jgi:uncharacterized damage-inducible protein DinB
MIKPLLLAIVLGGSSLHAQQDAREGMWKGYAGEWRHVSRQLVALAEAIPAEKYSWRPGPGVRSVSEVLMHITSINFELLSAVGPPMPAVLKSPDAEKRITQKTEVIDWLKRSLDAVKNAHASLTPTDLMHKVEIDNTDSTVDNVYLRIIIHDNEHMGQLVAYARMNGIVPPWSKSN